MVTVHDIVSVIICLPKLISELVSVRVCPWLAVYFYFVFTVLHCGGGILCDWFGSICVISLHTCPPEMHVQLSMFVFLPFYMVWTPSLSVLLVGIEVLSWIVPSQASLVPVVNTPLLAEENFHQTSTYQGKYRLIYQLHGDHTSAFSIMALEQHSADYTNTAAEWGNSVGAAVCLGSVNYWVLACYWGELGVWGRDGGGLPVVGSNVQCSAFNAWMARVAYSGDLWANAFFFCVPLLACNVILDIECIDFMPYGWDRLLWELHGE